MKNPIAQLFGQTAVYGLGIVLPRLLNYLLLTPFYTRVFDRANYGIVTELYAYVVFLLVILTYGMETGYFRFASQNKQKERVYTSVLSSLFVTSALFILLVQVFAPSLARIMDYAEHPEYLRWLAVIVGVDAFTSIPFARIRLQNKAFRYALVRLAEVSVNIALNLFFLWYCPKNSEQIWVDYLYNENVGVGYVFVSNLMASLVKLCLLLPEILGALKQRFDPGLIQRIWRYSYPLLLAGLAGTINEALDRVLLKHLCPEGLDPMEQLGVYGANYKLAVLMTLFVQMFKYAAEPFFFAKSGEKRARRLYADVMTFYVVSALFIFLLVNLYLDYFILFIGADFREGVHIVPVVLMANLVMGIFFNLSVWYKLSNKTRYGAVLVTMGAVITVVINAVFIPSFSYTASAWAHLVCYSVMVLFSFLWSRKHFPIPYRVGRIFLYICSAVALFMLNRLFLQDVTTLAWLWPLALLGSFATMVYFLEANTFRKYNKKQ